MSRLFSSPYPRRQEISERAALWRRGHFLWQTGFLTGIDGVTNLVDYAFHIFLARVLLAADFAIVQTVNTTVLILITAFAVFQPTVARYSSEASVHQYADHVQRGIFQFYFGRGLAVALPLMLIVTLARQPIADWLNVPISAVLILAFLLLPAIVRPIVAGQLQGQGQFISFGLTRLSNSLGRLGFAILLIGLWQGGLLSALFSLPIGGLMALLAGLSALGWHTWRPAPSLPRQFRHPGSHLMSAFLALTAYMSLLSMDLIWVNRLFSPDMAGAYATAVLLRRVLVLLPGAVIVVMYPRAVAQVAQKRIPDRLLMQTTAIVVLPTLLLTFAYGRYGSDIIGWTFGADYSHAASLLFVMSLGMIGFGLTAIWLNFFLATRPIPFVTLLVTTAIGQTVVFSRLHDTPMSIVLTFASSGWLAAIGGFLLYLAWLRPSLKLAASSTEGITDPT